MPALTPWHRSRIGDPPTTGGAAMSTDDANMPVWELVRGHAGRARVLAGFEIDYCCGGRTPLKEACSERGLDVEEVLRALEANDDAQPAADQVDWSGESMTR